MVLALIPFPGTTAMAAPGDVAQIGNKYYTTLQSAINAVPDGGTITLLSDITTSAIIFLGFTSSGTTTYTLDLGDFKINGDGSVGVYAVLSLVTDRKTVTLKAGPNGGVVNTLPDGCAIGFVDFHYINSRLNIDGGTYTGAGTAVDGGGVQVVITAGQFNGGATNGALYDNCTHYGDTITIANGSVATPANWKDITPATVTVTSATKPGDINGDGDVNLIDLNILLGLFGKSGANVTNPNADINGDGDVNLVDLNLLLGKFGT